MKIRADVVLVILASILLAGSTFADWFSITAVDRSMGFPNLRWASLTGDGTLFRLPVSAWAYDKPIAIGLVGLALVAVTFAVLGEVQKLRAQTSALVVTCAALAAVGLIVAQLAGDRTSQAFGITVTKHLLTGFYVAAAASAALLVAAAGHLARRATG